MGNAIHVPPGEAGDRALLRIIPNLHKMAKQEQNQNRHGDQ